MYQIVVTNEYSVTELANEWQALAPHCEEITPFLDWFWIGTWLRQLEPIKPILVKCMNSNVCVGMTLYCPSGQFGRQTWLKQAWFNKTGNRRYDQIWIEFNDFLIHKDHRSPALKTMLTWCSQQPIDEWILAITANPSRYSHHSCFDVERIEFPAYAVDLSEQTSTLDGYLALLSSNSRSTLRRALRYAEQTYGAIKLEIYRHRPPQEILNEIARLHIQRWQDDPQGSGFSNPAFVEFHTDLMDCPSQHSYCETIAFYAGEQCLGYAYYLIYQNQVYFYLSAIDYFDRTNRFQPGLIMHALAIEHYSKQGKIHYDFMGGDSRYKRSLATQSYSLCYLTLRKKSLKNQLLNALRKLRHKWD